MLRPNFILIGDSITQKSFSVGGWGAALSNTYQRKVDVLNRGYSGYNSRWILRILDKVLSDQLQEKILLATVFLGANDAALEDRASSRQHVPIPEYRSNLRSIVSRLRELGVPAVVIITPTPIDEPARIVDVEKKYGVRLEQPERTNEVTGQYAAACIQLSKELGLPVLDLWTGFQQEPGWQQSLLEDGLHLTPAGNAKVAELLQSLIETEFPSLRPSEMVDDAPLHSDIDPKDPDASFKEFYQKKKPQRGVLMT